jgi:hypothetical protein
MNERSRIEIKLIVSHVMLVVRVRPGDCTTLKIV